MTHEQALTKALALTITAPASRYEEALDLAYQLSILCTPAEIDRAKNTIESITGITD